MSIQQFFQSLGERLQKSANVKTVYGEPMVAEGKTIVPVARVAYGFCGCSRNKKKKGESKAQNEGAEEGGGAGLTASPVGVVEVTSEGTRFVAIGDERKWAGALIIGLFLGIFLGRRRSGR
ncbi:MAG: GerW family sporulation protein [Candidatus Methylomirabilales bacterium]